MAEPNRSPPTAVAQPADAQLDRIKELVDNLEHELAAVQTLARAVHPHQERTLAALDAWVADCERLDRTRRNGTRVSGQEVSNAIGRHVEEALVAHDGVRQALAAVRTQASTIERLSHQIETELGNGERHIARTGDRDQRSRLRAASRILRQRFRTLLRRGRESDIGTMREMNVEIWARMRQLNRMITGTDRPPKTATQRWVETVLWGAALITAGYLAYITF